MPWLPPPWFVPKPRLREWVGQKRGWSDEFSQIGLPWSEARVYTNYLCRLSHQVNQGGGENFNHIFSVPLGLQYMKIHM